MRDVSILWKELQVKENDTLFLLAEVMIEAWGRNRESLQHFLDKFNHSVSDCIAPLDVELFIKQGAGYWSPQREFWMHEHKGQPLAELLIAALRKIDTITDTFEDRLTLRKLYLNQIEANVIGTLLTLKFEK